jgi:hypothetical protein
MRTMLKERIFALVYSLVLLGIISLAILVWVV